MQGVWKKVPIFIEFLVGKYFFSDTLYVYIYFLMVLKGFP